MLRVLYLVCIYNFANRQSATLRSKWSAKGITRRGCCDSRPCTLTKRHHISEWLSRAKALR